MWLKCTNGTSIHYFQIARIDRFIVSGSLMTLYVNGMTITQFPIAVWNAGEVLDDLFVLIGPSPMQV